MFGFTPGLHEKRVNVSKFVLKPVMQASAAQLTRPLESAAQLKTSHDQDIGYLFPLNESAGSSFSAYE